MSDDELQVLILFTKGSSTSTDDSRSASIFVRSHGVKVITIYIGLATSRGYNEERQVVSDIGELVGLRVDEINDLISQAEIDLLQRTANIPTRISGQLPST